MIPVKIQCACGQRYAFDIVPHHGRMPSPVACPACGADGTAAANEIIAQALAAQPATAPMMGVRLDAPASAPTALAPPPIPRIAAPTVARAVPPPVPPPTPRTVVQPKPKRQPRSDGWATPETGLNKVGSYIVIGVGIFAAMLSAGFFGAEIAPRIMCVIVGIAGVVGGALNILGRGPILAGILIGLVISFGGYGAVYWWIHGRRSVFWLEATLAFIIGAIPGMLLQYLLQQILKKRAAAAG